MLPIVPSFVPNLLQIAPFVLAFSFLCADPLRKHPGPFYALWALAVVSVTWFDPVIAIMGEHAPASAQMAQSFVDALPMAFPALDAVVKILTSSFTGVSFYLIVMFIGAIERTPAVKRLLSIRTELSVIGGIIIMGHVVRIVDFPLLFANPAWVEIWGHPAADFMFVAAVLVGIPLTLVFLVPWVTSFRLVRRRMTVKTWKRVQKLAYPFMALMIAQGFLLALGHLLFGYPYDGMQVAMAFGSDPTGWLATFAQQVATAWMYLTLGVLYLALRLRKHFWDKARRAKIVGDARSSGGGISLPAVESPDEAAAAPIDVPTGRKTGGSTRGFSPK